MSATELPSDLTFKDRVAALRSDLSAAERKVADYMAANPERAATWSATELATELAVSDATVVRTARSLGYSGLRELKRMALSRTERRRDPSLVLSDRIHQLVDDNQPTLGRVIDDTSDLLRRLDSTIDADAWQLALDYIIQARHVYTYGVGLAGSCADFLSTSLSRIGVSSTSTTTTGISLADTLLHVSASDTVVIFALLRQFREVEVFVKHAHLRGARVVLVSEVRSALAEKLASRVDALLRLPASTMDTGSGTAVGLAVAHALQLAVATQRPERAVHTMQEMNRLRAEIVGDVPDTDISPNQLFPLVVDDVTPA